MTKVPANAVSWFSIPATDFDKSVRFFEDLLQIKLMRSEMVEGQETVSYAMFPRVDGGVGGAVTPADRVQPARGGVLVYLACVDIDAALGRVESLGGAVLAPKMPLPEGMGDIAVIYDCEGTPIGLHQD